MVMAGTQGGSWTEETHMSLYPGAPNFNSGMAKFIASTFRPLSFLEFGSGLGFLAHHIRHQANVEKAYCIEPCEIKGKYDATSGPFLLPINIFTDPLPATLTQKFDLVYSIEVAEHIEREHHSFLFDFLVSRASNWIVFSAATPGQAGHGHVAERPEQEWRDELLQRGLIYYEDLTHAIRRSCNIRNINHKKNVMVFRTS